MRRTLIALAALTSCLAAGCYSEEATNHADPLFERVPPEQTGIRFANRLRESEELNVITYELFYNGAGVGVGDLDGDGRQDLFFASNRGKSRLYLNEGNFAFTDATASSGIQTEGKWANGVTVVDVNQDGRQDIYLSIGGPYTSPRRRANELYVNEGGGAFTEQAQAYGLDDTGRTTHTAFFDYDKDGDLDAYLLTNGVGPTGPNVIRPKKTNGEAANADRLYRQNDDGTFSDASEEANVLVEGYGLDVTVFDPNGDGWPDVYVSNDYLANDLLYVNNQDGTFTDRAADYFRHQSYAAMGNDIADINNDGLMDVVTLDMLPRDNRGLKQMYGAARYDRYRSEQAAGYAPQVKRNTLQLRVGTDPEGRPAFSEVGQLAGVHATDWSWGALLADFDNDGWRDLAVTNGIPRDVTNRDFADYKMNRLARGPYSRAMELDFVEAIRQLGGVHKPNYLFKNNGDLTFADKSEEWGLGKPSFSTGAAFADLDGDGDLDLVINNVNEEASVYRNTAAQKYQRRYLNVALAGPPGNAAGLGARVTVYYQGKSQHHRHTPYRGYKSTVEPAVHFGLGEAAAVDSLVVVWPDARRQVVRDVQSGQTVTVRHSRAGRPSAPPAAPHCPADSQKASPLFRRVTQEREVGFEHAEQHYADFKIQPLLPHKHSQNGPGLAVGDADGDGRQDFYVGGAFGQSGAVYLQAPDGTFDSTRLSGGPSYEEDLGPLFFDADGDGDQDLYVVSGGSEFKAGSPYYQDRLYLNDGAGAFTHAPGALPTMRTSGSSVAATDYDKDGDLDLFVGGRVVPNQYPVAPRSYLLENQGGTFVDATPEQAAALAKPGMVTAALWTDFNDDQWTDLIVVGEWMPITLFENRKGTLVDATGEHGLSGTVGWWNSIAAGDFDRDGDTDYAAGNLGLNTRLKNRPAGPVRMHAGDMNGDGRTEAVISRFIDGESYPVHFRDDLVNQMPSLGQRFPSYAQYAQAPLKEVLTEEQRSGAAVYASNTFATSYLENEGGSGFDVRALPTRTQFAPVFGIASGDYSGDGTLDLLLLGNSYATEVFTGRYDASNGLLLRGDGRGGFEPADVQDSDFYVEGDGKAVAEMATASGTRLLLTTRNGGALAAFEVREPRALLRGLPSETKAEVVYRSGAVEKVEFYRGSGYLSQSSRSLAVPDSARRIHFYGRGGERRAVTPGG